MCHLQTFLPKWEFRKTLAQIIISCFAVHLPLAPRSHDDYLGPLCLPRCADTAHEYHHLQNFSAQLLCLNTANRTIWKSAPFFYVLIFWRVIWPFINGKGVYSTNNFYAADWMQIICLHYIFVGRKGICSVRKGCIVQSVIIGEKKKNHIFDPLRWMHPAT